MTELSCPWSTPPYALQREQDQLSCYGASLNVAEGQPVGNMMPDVSHMLPTHTRKSRGNSGDVILVEFRGLWRSSDCMGTLDCRAPLLYDSAAYPFVRS